MAQQGEAYPAKPSAPNSQQGRPLPKSSFAGSLKQCCDVLLEGFEKFPARRSSTVPRSLARRSALVYIIKQTDRVKAELRDHPVESLTLETAFGHIEEKMNETFAYTRLPMKPSQGIFELKPQGPRNTCQLLARFYMRMNDNRDRTSLSFRVKENQCQHILEEAFKQSLLRAHPDGNIYGIPTVVTYEELHNSASVPVLPPVQVLEAVSNPQPSSASTCKELVLWQGPGQVPEDSSSEEPILASPSKKRKHKQTNPLDSLKRPVKKVKSTSKKIGTKTEPLNVAAEKRSNTTEEKTKAMILTLDGYGMIAPEPCRHCKPGKCLIAIYPRWFDSQKCQKCIRQKNGCCFATRTESGVDADGTLDELWKQNRNPYDGKSWQDIAKERGLREMVLQEAKGMTRQKAAKSP